MSEARAIFGPDWLGPEELAGAAAGLGVRAPVSPAPEPARYLELGRARPGAYVLVHGAAAMADGAPITLLRLRAHFGLDPAIHEPCFYNQDWYLKERFAADPALEARYYLVRKTLRSESRGQPPEAFTLAATPGAVLPSALLCAYTFFAFYLARRVRLWEHDYVWCSDEDHQGDRVYVGRYEDPNGVNKNGFSVHRHLRLRECHGVAEAVA